MDTDKIKLKRMLDERNKRVSDIDRAINDYKAEKDNLYSQIETIEKLIVQIDNNEWEE